MKNAQLPSQCRDQVAIEIKQLFDELILICSHDIVDDNTLRLKKQALGSRFIVICYTLVSAHILQDPCY